ncbi:MAG TPA: SpoIIE family protein phosphatase [Acidimicrobiales bacterium]|jgi:PAS domain-containing protein
MNEFMVSDPSDSTSPELALEAAGVGIWEFDIERGELRSDDQTALLLGIYPGAPGAEADSLLDRIHPDDLVAVQAAMQAAAERGDRFAVEYRVLRPDGTTSWVQTHGRASFDQDHRATRILGVGVDTTDLRTARERATHSLEHVPDGLLVVDRQWRVVFLNAQAARLLRRSATELLGEDLWVEFPQATEGGEFWDRYHEAMQTQDPATFEAYYGEEGWVEVRLFPTPDTLTIYLRDINGRRNAEEERDRLVATVQATLARAQQLQAIMTALGEAMTLDHVVEVVLEQTRELLGTLFVGLMVFGDDGHSVRLVRLDQLPDGLVERWVEAGQEGSSPLGDAIAGRRPLFHGSRQAHTEDYPHLDGVAEALGGQASASLPLVAGGRVIGALALAWSEEHAFDAEERTFLLTLARQCGEAIQRAVLFEQQHRVATILQRAILPDELPDLEDLRFAARYLPAEEGVEVGGDWYDAFRGPGGTVWLSVGDVGGHGVPAASVMSQLRNSVRACAFAGLGPSGSLDVLDRLLIGTTPDLYATAVVVAYDPRTGTLRWSNAGHPPPLIASPDNAPRVLEAVHGSLLGLNAETPFGESETEFPPGGLLVLYTDGLIERRGGDLQESLSTLAATISRMTLTRDVQALCDRVLASAFTGHNKQDDLCLLLAQRRVAASTR